MTILVACALLAQPPLLDTTCPDTVGAGETFSLVISTEDPSCSVLSSTPPASSGLTFVNSRSMRSTSSINGRVSQTLTLELVYIASGEGLQTIGPLQVRTGAGALTHLPAESVFVAASSPQPAAASPRGTRVSVAGRGAAWIEVGVPEGPLYPGVPFAVRYDLLSRVMVKDVETWFSPPGNGTASVLEAPETLVWRVQPVARRAHLMTLEVTAASPGRTSLPVIQANVWQAGSMFFGDGPVHYVVSDTAWADVDPFPAGGMPEDFGGLADSVSFQVEPVSGADGRDALVLLTAEGPGARMLHTPPRLTAGAGADVTVLSGGAFGDGARWEMLVSAGDSGTVVIGPDSVAWFDRRSLEYRHAHIDPCTLHLDVSRPLFDPEARDLLSSRRRNGRSFPYFVLGALVLAAVLIGIITRRSGSAAATVASAGDAEELLTAFECGLGERFCGRTGHFSPEIVEDMMEEEGVPQLVQRRVLRLWKDLENAVSAGGAGGSRLAELRRNCAEALDELGRRER